MKHLPCEFCRGEAYMLLKGEHAPLIVGRISHFPYKYKCSRCKRLNSISAVAFNRLPSLPAEKELAS